MNTKAFVSVAGLFVSLSFFAYAVSDVLSDLPPDPGKTGEQSLEGVDSNHNGVRDDVERYIGLHYAESAKTRAALTQYARSLQEKIASSKDKPPSLEPTHKVMRSFECLVYVVGISSATQMSTDFQALMVNTQERFKAYMASEASGTDGFVLSQKSERKKQCSFDPDSFPN